MNVLKDHTMEFPAVVNPDDKNKPLTWKERAVMWTACVLLVIGTFWAFPPPSDAARLCTVPTNVTVKGRRIERDQRVNTTIALRLADRMHVTQKQRYALVAAATQEQSQHNLPYGHGTSVGYLQLIDIHGDVAWRMKVVNSAGWFLRGAQRADRPGMSVGGLADAVQRPRTHGLYDQWVREARRTTLGYQASCR